MKTKNLREYLSRMNKAYSSILSENKDVFVTSYQDHIGRGLFDSQVEDNWYFLLPLHKRKVDKIEGIVLTEQDKKFIKQYEHVNPCHRFPINSERSTIVRAPEKIELDVLEELCKKGVSFSRRYL